MGVLHHIGGLGKNTILLIRLSVAVEVVSLAVVVLVHLLGGKDIGLPRRKDVGIGFDLGQAVLRQQVLVGALVADHHEVVRLGIRRVEDDVAVLVHVLGIQQLRQLHVDPC